MRALEPILVFDLAANVRAEHGVTEKQRHPAPLGPVAGR